MSVEQADQLQAWALSVPVRQPPAEVSEIANHLEYMLAALPTRVSDEEDGKKRLAVYVKLLRPFGDDALAHMARRACEELDWFPSARWCVEDARSHHGLTADRCRLPIKLCPDNQHSRCWQRAILTAIYAGDIAGMIAEARASSFGRRGR